MHPINPTHVIIVFALLVCLGAIRFRMLRVGEGLQRGNALVETGKILLNHICQLGYFDGSVVEE